MLDCRKVCAHVLLHVARWLPLVADVSFLLTLLHVCSTRSRFRCSRSPLLYSEPRFLAVVFFCLLALTGSCPQRPARDSYGHVAWCRSSFLACTGVVASRFDHAIPRRAHYPHLRTARSGRSHVYPADSRTRRRVLFQARLSTERVHFFDHVVSR